MDNTEFLHLQLNLAHQPLQYTPAPNKDCCDFCNDGSGHCAFPYYGVAPHNCFYKLDGVPGQSEELPQHDWPANFVLDPATGPSTGFPRAGTYTHCLHCGRPGRVAQQEEGRV